MDDEQKRRHLRKADEDIAAAWRRIDEQRDRIAKMATDGHKTETGEALLQTMMDSVHAMEDHRRTILRESAARSRCCTPARAPTGGRLSQRARGRRGDQARGRERGPPLHPDFRGRRRSRVLPRRRRPHGHPARRPRHPGQQRGVQAHAGELEGLSDEHFDRTIKTNLYGYFYMAKAAVPHMKPGSAIVMTGSVTGLLGSKHLLDYSLTKGGIHAFTRSLASHLVPRGIRVNAVAPGPVWTPLNPADRPAEAVAKSGADTPMKRPAQPEEIAPAFVFLAAPSCSSYITGEILPIIGGYSGG